MGRRLIASSGLALALYAVTFPAFGQESVKLRVLAQTKGGELSAEIPDRPDWCKPDLTFTIRAQEDSYFKEGEVDDKGRRGRFLLQRLLGVIRVGLKSECPQAKSITFNGFVDDIFIYRGYAATSGGPDDWVLIELPVNLVPAPEPPPPDIIETAAPPPRPAAVGECDTLAAHPDDPDKPRRVRGVSDDNIKAGQAAETCEEALLVEPDNPRLMYQLARAYLMFGKAAEGVDLMTEAAEEGHPVAIASLGDFATYGLLDGEPDPETGKALYERAAKAGFKPAAKLAEAIRANPKEDKGQEVTNEPVYTHPNMLQAMLTGGALPGRDEPFIRMIAYGTSVMGGIIYHCPDAGIKISEYQIINTIKSRTNAIVSFLGMAALGDGTYADVEQAGMDDGYALAFSKGCKSREVAAVHHSLSKTFSSY